MSDLLLHHLEDLRRSGLAEETIRALGFYSGDSGQVREILGFDAGPGLVIPYPRHAAMPAFHRVKPDNPPLIEGKRPKYLSPMGAGLYPYIPRGSWEALKEPRTKALITEGEKKAAKADQEAFPCIGLGGIYGFRDRSHLFLPTLTEIPWSGREVPIIPDSDVVSNQNVRCAVWELAWQLHQRQAQPVVKGLPPQDDGSKQGLDDFLIAHGRDRFVELLSKAEPLAEWACGVVAAMPPAQKTFGFHWLIPRLKSLDATALELAIECWSQRLGISKGFFRKQIKEVTQWAPSPPRVEREQAAEQRRQVEAQDQVARLADEAIRVAAMDLLGDPALLHNLCLLLDSMGLAGEKDNGCIIYLAVTSRVQRHPICLTVKGESSGGKSYLVERVLTLFPPEAYLALTGMSRQALVYSDEPLSHRTVVIFERGGMEAADYNIRTLQSEGKIIFETVERDPATNEQHTVRKEKAGPANFIFTTTAPQIHQENETRHWSIFVDESPEQTEAIKGKIAEQ